MDDAAVGKGWVQVGNGPRIAVQDFCLVYDHAEPINRDGVALSDGTKVSWEHLQEIMEALKADKQGHCGIFDAGLGPLDYKPQVDSVAGTEHSLAREVQYGLNLVDRFKRYYQGPRAPRCTTVIEIQGPLTLVASLAAAQIQNTHDDPYAVRAVSQWLRDVRLNGGFDPRGGTRIPYNTYGVPNALAFALLDHVTRINPLLNLKGGSATNVESWLYRVESRLNAICRVVKGATQPERSEYLWCESFCHALAAAAPTYIRPTPK